MDLRVSSPKRVSALAFVCTALLIAFLAPPAASAYDYSYARVVRLSLVEGDVQVARPDAQGWEAAVVNLPIQQGFTVATGQGRAEIEFESGATARLAENSVLQFTELALSSGARITKLSLTQGTATFYANLAHEDSFVVATPQLHVGISENARFRVDVLNEGTSVSLLKGEVDVDSRAGTSRVSKGHTLVYNASDPDHASLERNPKADDWDRWVAERDEVVHTGNTNALRYVSSPYYYGLSDLYNYGTWFPYGGYGLCWRPYGVGLNWYPFWYGRWGFFPSLGWTWISYEPWGWLPYHFGRWVFSPSFGWIWVPGSFHQWQPAVVSWVRLRNGFGWVPQAPQDRLGQTPTNLQHGVITTSNGFIGANPDNITGFIGAKPFVRRFVIVGDDPEVVAAPPAAMGIGQRPSGTAVRTGPPPAATGGDRDSGGIVFDPRERKFVNRSTGPARVGDVPGDARMQVETPPAARGGSRVAPPAGPAPVQPPPDRGGSRPTPSPRTPVFDRDRDVTPRAAPPPRVEHPPMRSEPPPRPQVFIRDRDVAPRAEAPRATPPPRAERPPMRTESPRPAPPPRMEAPRMSAPRPAPRAPAHQQ
jgi:hypothetical protein